MLGICPRTLGIRPAEVVYLSHISWAFVPDELGKCPGKVGNLSQNIIT